MYHFRVTVKPLHIGAEIHEEDRYLGRRLTWDVDARTEKLALDRFHETWPIKVLEDFDITIRRVDYR